MEYQEYKRSAERHLNTCERLLQSLKDCSSHSEKQNILSNIYYLSGYVIESSLSYLFFAANDYDGEIENSDDYKTGGFKTHLFQRKIDYIHAKIGSRYLKDIPMISNKSCSKDLLTLYNSWKPDFRYTDKSSKVTKKKHLNESVLKSYINTIKIVNNKLISRVS